MWFVPVVGDGTTSGAGSGVVVTGVAVPGCSDGTDVAGSVGSGNGAELVLGSVDGDELVSGAWATRDPYGSAFVGGGSIAQALRSTDALSTNACRRPVAISQPSHSCDVNHRRRAAGPDSPLA